MQFEAYSLHVFNEKFEKQKEREINSEIITVPPTYIRRSEDDDL